MALKHKAQIQREVLSWAIDRADVSLDELAKAAGTSETVVRQWLDGDRLPSFIQARKAATKLHVPLGVLFLSEPPTESLPIADFRTVAGTQFAEPSPELQDVLHAILRRKTWLSEYLEETGADPVAVVGSASNPDSGSALAGQIRQLLDLTSFARPPRADEFLRELVRRTEAIGVNVARNGVVGNNTHRPLNVAEFRGFSISDKYAPFIFINGNDSRAAQVFTLIHELAHIIRGDSGISSSSLTDVGRIESVCNAAAADALVPRDEFAHIWNESVEVDEAIAIAARHFRVSRYVVAIRAYESGTIDQDQLDDLLDRFRADFTDQSRGSGGDFYKTLVTRNGRSFTSQVVEALHKQHVLTRDAALMLDTKVSRLPRISRELHGA